MTKTLIKKTILAHFPDFKVIKKVADVEATINGQHVRVVIKKGEALAVKVDGQVVWTPGQVDVMDKLQELVSGARRIDHTAIAGLFAEIPPYNVPKVEPRRIGVPVMNHIVKGNRRIRRRAAQLGIDL